MLFRFASVFSLEELIRVRCMISIGKGLNCNFHESYEALQKVGALRVIVFGVGRKTITRFYHGRHLGWWGLTSKVLLNI